jgi:hypothetical protein
MRKFYFTLLLLVGLLIDNAKAQNTFPPTGNVGIGISPAGYPFHVRNTNASNRARFQFGAGIIDLVTYSTGTFAYSNSSGLFVNQQDALVMAGSNKDIRFVTHPSDYIERMRIKANGNIGIGTVNPVTLIHVKEDVPKYITFERQGLVKRGHVGYSIDRDGAVFIGTDDNTHTLWVQQNGNVGIGTLNPSHKLEVNGTIRAKEVKLEAANWPDYVFEKGYQLMPLEEVKSHIDQKGHLPGLKSAEEYEAEGVNMMELNQRLLEKIEELTLYQIELLSRIKLLESKSK